MAEVQFISAKILDAKSDARRSRHILAASGQVLESGEVRDLAHLYVMGRDGKLIKVSNLSNNPKKQKEDYSVQAQADHGEIVDGELIPTVEKQFGSCKVWLADDGLHAQMYFADNDQLADHAWAVSEDASYSVGIDWFEDGYYGADNAIADPVGILREISMVLTGNDPRAKTIDSKSPTQEAQGSEAEIADNKLLNKENKMPETKDNLTPDEARAMSEELAAVVEKFTTSAPEDETEPTATDKAEGVEEKTEDKADEPETQTATKDQLHNPVVVIRDRVVGQEKAVAKNVAWSKTEAGRNAFRDALRQSGMHFGDGFNAAIRRNFSKDGVTGLSTPAPVEQIFVSALEGADGIISHFRGINTKSFRVKFLSADQAAETGRAHGHKKGDEKINQEITANVRDVFPLMVYKKLDLDAAELYENPELYDFRAQELAEQVVRGYEQAAITGDGRSEPASGDADYRMFNGTRGFYSIKADAAETSGAGSLAASTITLTSDDNLYTAIVKARAAIKAAGKLVVITKSEMVTDLLTATTSGNGFLIQPGTNLEQLLDVVKVYTPDWMDDDTNSVYVFAENQYGLVGEANLNNRTDFDTSKNTDILLAEAMRGGSLLAAKSAVAIAPAT